MTPYSKIYNRFLTKIVDLDLINLSQEVAEETMHEYMLSSCDNFTQCKQDLSQRDDTAKQFLIELTGFEINIIATGMLYEWIQPHINNILSVKQYLSGPDFKTYSQANHLKELQSLRDSYEERMERLMTRYGYDFNDWGKLGLG